MVVRSDAYMFCSLDLDVEKFIQGEATEGDEVRIFHSCVGALEAKELMA